MSASQWLATILEFALIVLAILGLIFEEKVIKFEDELVEVAKLMPSFFKALSKRIKRKISRWFLKRNINANEFGLCFFFIEFFYFAPNLNIWLVCGIIKSTIIIWKEDKIMNNTNIKSKKRATRKFLRSFLIVSLKSIRAIACVVALLSAGFGLVTFLAEPNESFGSGKDFLLAMVFKTLISIAFIAFSLLSGAVTAKISNLFDD